MRRDSIVWVLLIAWDEIVLETVVHLRDNWLELFLISYIWVGIDKLNFLFWLIISWWCQKLSSCINLVLQYIWNFFILNFELYFFFGWIFSINIFHINLLIKPCESYYFKTLFSLLLDFL
jgi:hypothetical protein